MTFNLPTITTLTVPYVLSASLNASGHAPACSTIDVVLSGDADAEHLLVQAPDSAIDPGCSAAPPGQLEVEHEGYLQTSTGDITFQMAATIEELDPGVHRTDTLRADWTVTLRLFPACTVPGHPTGETLTGTGGADVICGMGGVDTLNGLGGDDVIFGGDDADTIDGGAGNDVLVGLGGADTIQGGSDDDVIFGGRGNDHISDTDSSGGSNLLSGEDGNDSICGSNQGDVILGGPGDDLILGFGGSDVIAAGDGEDTVEGEGSATDALAIGCSAPSGAQGTHLDDVIGGGAGDDKLFGGPGPDTIEGNAGSDLLRGEDGADTLIGGTRKDVLNGGDGPDVLNACDGVLDGVIGGPGTDKARIDAGVDNVHTDVEVRKPC